MGRLTSAVHWWEECQMRVLVLGSLVVQFLLLIFTFLRRLAIPGWIRFIMWLAYLGGDAIAIYALATLFNRHKDQDRGGNNMLEVVWAPILLLHLGGHDGITAYNIEDNELWSRHLLTAVSQVTVAIYVFWKSWPPGGDKSLLWASILLFVPGVLKCFTKPWALKRASITSLVSSPDAKRTAKKSEAGEMDPNSPEVYVKRAKAFVQEQKDEGDGVENDDHPPPLQAKLNKDEMDPFEEYVKRKRDFVVGEQKDEGRAQGESASVEDSKRTDRGKEWTRQRILRGEARKLFVDISSRYSGRRLSIFKYFWVITATTRKSKEEEDKAAPPDSSKKEDQADTAYGYVRRGLASAFVLLYTKIKTAAIIPTGNVLEMDERPATVIGHCLLLIMASRVYLPWAVIGLFHKSHREAYSDTDVKITYAILCCTAVLEACSFSPISSMVRPLTLRKRELRTSGLPLFTVRGDVSGSHDPLIISREQWPEMVAQYSLIGYFARNKNHGKVMWVASKLGCRDLVDRHWCMESCSSSSSRRITELVLQYLKAGWRVQIHDVASHRSFIDNRGQWALEGYEDELGWSIKEPFDESVLLWHIATDLCFFLSPFSEQRRADDFAKVTMPTVAVQCRHMSNYMVYLLFVNPEMLLPGTRRNIFTTAYDELKDILGDNKLNPLSFCCCCQQLEERELVKTLIKTMQDKSSSEIGSQEESKEGQPKGGSSGNFVDDAWDLALGLLKLRGVLGEEQMWYVIQGVWVEMLCFSASRCRGYLHAKALGSGGEFLSYVWLLLFYMGMETLADRLQREREELPNQDQEGNYSRGLWAQAPRAYRIRSRGASSPSHLHTGASTSNSEIHIADMV